MKKYLFIIMLFPIISFAQLNKDSIIWENTSSLNNYTLFVGSIVPKHQLVISGDNNKQLYLDFKGDSLKVSGDLKMDEAAIKFIKFLQQTYPHEIFRLNHDSTEITFNGVKYLKTNK